MEQHNLPRFTSDSLGEQIKAQTNQMELSHSNSEDTSQLVNENDSESPPLYVTTAIQADREEEEGGEDKEEEEKEGQGEEGDEGKEEEKKKEKASGQLTKLTQKELQKNNESHDVDTEGDDINNDDNDAD